MGTPGHQLRAACLALGLCLPVPHAPRAPDHFGVPQGLRADLTEPTDAAVDAAGWLFVAESGAHRVRVFGAQGEVVRTWGGRGSDVGQFLGPASIALAGRTLVFVADTGNHRIQVFTRDGGFVRAFGSFGKAPGELHSPLGLAVDAERVYVADSGNHRLQIFDHAGECLGVLGSHGTEPGSFRRPVDVALDRRGSLYVVDAWNHRVQKLHKDGTPLKVWGNLGPHPGWFNDPAGIDYSDGKLYVADRFNHRICVFDTEGKWLSNWGEPALQPSKSQGRLFAPSSVCISPSGKTAWVCEPRLGRCQEFGRAIDEQHSDDGGAAGMSLTRYGFRGGGDGSVLALTDPETRSVGIYDVSSIDPLAIGRIGTSGGPAQRLLAPVDAAVDARAELVHVTDAGLARVLTYRLQRDAKDPLGYDRRLPRLVRSLDFRQLAAGGENGQRPWPIVPGAVARGPEGKLFVADEANLGVCVLGPELQILDWWGGRGWGSSEFLSLTDIAVDASGRALTVVDSHSGRVRSYSLDGQLMHTWGATEEGSSPFGVALVGERLLITDAGLHRITMHDSTTNGTSAWGERGDGAAQFFQPRDLIPAMEHLYLLDSGNRRGQVLSLEGRFRVQF